MTPTSTPPTGEDAKRPLTPHERELAARTAVIAGKRFSFFGWCYGSEDDDHVPDAESIAETIEYLIAQGGGTTGRLMVETDELGLNVYLHLGLLTNDDEPEVMVDEDPDDSTHFGGPT